MFGHQAPRGRHFGSEREQRARAELPHPGEGGEEGLGRIRVRVEHGHHEGEHAHHRDEENHRQPAPAAEELHAQPGRPEQKQRPEDVELLLERQRPVVLHHGRVVRGEVVDRAEGERPVLEVEGAREDLPERVHQAGQRQDEQRRDGGEHEHGDGCRQQPAHALRPEGRQPDPPRPLQFAGQLAGDEVAGDDEEDVDADVAAGEAPRPEVVEHHEDDGNRPQPLDVRLKVSRLRRAGTRAQLSHRVPE